MKFQRYQNNDVLITSEEHPGYHFRRMYNAENQRLKEYIEGTLTTLTPEDFGDVTVLKEEVLNGNIALSNIDSENAPMSSSGALNYIELGNSIVQLGTDPAGSSLLWNLASTEGENTSLPVTIVMPASLRTIYGSLGPVGVGLGQTFDFTALRSNVPTWTVDSSLANYTHGTILVTASALATWQNAPTWSSVADNIQGVEI